MEHSITVVVSVRDAEQAWMRIATTLTRNRDPRVAWLIVDDGSRDRTGDLAEAWAAADGHAKVLHFDEPVGLPGGWNAALDLVQTRFVTFVEAPDWCAPGRMVGLLGAASELGVAFVRTDHVLVRGDRRGLARAPERRHGVSLPARSGIGDGRGDGMVDYTPMWAGAYDLQRLVDGLRFDEALGREAEWALVWSLHLGQATYGVVRVPSYYRSEESRLLLPRPGSERMLAASRCILNEVRRFGTQAHMRHAIYSICHRAAKSAVAASVEEEAASREFVAEVQTVLDELPEHDLRWVLARMSTTRTGALQQLGIALPDFGELR